MLATAAGTTSQDGYWAYIVVFLLVFAGWVGIPAIGAAAIGGASVLASQGTLEIVPVLVVSVLGGAVGGLVGYQLGRRYGRRFLERPGLRREKREQGIAQAEHLYAKWGRLAVFFTPGWMTGIARMAFSSFVIWNFLASVVFTLSTGPVAYGAGKVSTGSSDSHSVGYLVFGGAMAYLAYIGLRRYRGRRDARKAAVFTSGRRVVARAAPGRGDTDLGLLEVSEKSLLTWQSDGTASFRIFNDSADPATFDLQTDDAHGEIPLSPGQYRHVSVLCRGRWRIELQRAGGGPAPGPAPGTGRHPAPGSAGSA
jgi:membrane protein DedA with SNARE-associated domain